MRDSKEESLIYLLDDSFLIKLSKEENIYPSYFYDFLTKYKKNLGASYIIKFNNFIDYGSNINYFINKKNLIHKDCDTLYFKEEAKKLFKYLEEFPNQLVSFEEYYLIIYGLYFKLFTSEELQIINQLFKNTNQLYVYNSKKIPDFNTEFVGKLLLNNNIDFKIEKKKYYDDMLYISKNNYVGFYYKNEKLKYILYLIEDLMKSNFIILNEESLYLDVKEILIENLDFLSYKSGYTKNQLVRKINKYLTYDDNDE